MEPIISQISRAFRTAIQDAFGVDADPLIVPSQNESFGDYQSNAAMGLAKILSEKTGQKTNPRQVAEQIVAKLDLGDVTADKPTVAGPGFINVCLSPKWLACLLQQAGSDERLGILRKQHPQTVVIDYSAPNVAKEMHVGHLRTTVIGDALSRLFEFLGDRVIRQNHIGDWGTQFGMLIAHLQNLDPSASQQIKDLDRFYKEARKRFESDPAFADEARANVVRLQSGGKEQMALWQRLVEVSRAHFQPIYDQLGIKLTLADERGESFYNPMLPAVVADLKNAGIAIESEGAIAVFTHGREAPIIIEKSGGGFGYATTDLAAIRHRVGQFRADRIIYVVGSPQSQHLQQVFDTAQRAGWANNVVLEHASFGSVLGEDGKMFKARSGDSVKLQDLLGEAEQRALAIIAEKNPTLSEPQRLQIAHAVGMGAIKYADLSKDRIGDYVFSWDKMLAMDGNTAPYLQYVYARIKSIFRKAGQDRQPAGLIELDSSFESSLAKHILRLSEVIEIVARDLKPHHLCNYLYELATKFSAFYENCPVLQSDEPTRASRLRLCELTARTMALGLDLLGIEHPEQM